MNDNKTIVFSTHITSDLERIAADIIFIKSGEISFYGELSELKESIVRLRIISDNKIIDNFPFNNIIKKEIDSNRANLTIKNPVFEQIRKYETQSGNTVTIDRLNLEEIFLELNK